MERVASARSIRPDAAGQGMQAALARVGAVEDFAALEALLEARRAEALEIVETYFAT